MARASVACAIQRIYLAATILTTLCYASRRYAGCMNLLGALRPTAVPIDPLEMASGILTGRVQEQAAIKVVQVQRDMTRTMLNALDLQVGTRLDRRG